MLKDAILRFLPRAMRDAVGLSMERRALAALPSRSCRAEKLRETTPPIVDWPEWDEVTGKANQLGATPGAVNPGDRRAIYSLTRMLQPRSVLEIGTHLGGSTVMFALALQHGQQGGRLTTVDILDVNGPEGAWATYGTRPPKQLVADAGCAEIVTFAGSPSVDFMRTCTQKFDLIFLDGGHEAQTVYQEVPLALDILQDNGVILLHDYYPELKALWSDGAVIPGPVLAIERFQQEGARIRVQPMGKLPWPTKLGSSITSLAFLVRA
jgi:predicted O-methyltransferase YrrM